MLFKHLFKAGAYGIIMLIEFLTLIVILGAVLVGVLLYHPEWIINEKNLRTAAEVVLPRFGVTMEFASFQADFPKKNLYDRGIGIGFEKLKIKTDTMTFIAPLFGLAAGFNIHPSHPALTLIGPVIVQEGVFALKLPPKDPYEDEEPFEWDDQIMKKIRQISWEVVSVHFKEINIEKGDQTLLKGPLKLDVYNDKRQWTVDFESGRLIGSPLLQSKIKLDVRLPAALDATFPLEAKINGNANIAEQGRVKLEGNVNVVSLDDVRYRLSGSLNSKGKPIIAKVSGFFDNGKFASEIEGRADGLVAQLPQLQIRRCRLEGSYSFEGPEIIDSMNRCEIFFERIRMPDELAFADLSPTTLNVNISAPLRLTLKDKQTYLEASPVKAFISPISNDVYNLKASIVGSFKGFLSASTDTIKSEINVDSALEIPEFQKLVRRLEPTPYAIPAPLHTLAGRVACNTQGKVVNFGEQLDFPLQCATGLRSSVQALVIDVKGVIQTWMDRKPRLKLDVLFKDVAFELPKMRIEDPIPQFVPDPRLKTEIAEKPTTKTMPDQALPIELAITIKTEKPARLQTHILKGEAVPVGIDLQIMGDRAQMKGEISIKNYTVNFLKRKALVDHVIIKLDPSQESPELDGLFVFKETDFRIDLILKGTADRPFYYLESDPPRSPTQLLSMLMYGGEAEELDTEGQRSVEETRAAMVDGALGLLSMYYLASTPIDSVGYNPYTGVFRARVKLAKGLSLSVGSDLGGAQQSVGLRKRLSENWSFETTAETDEETNESKGVALFKWDRRY